MPPSPPPPPPDSVWLFLVERAIDTGPALALFWHEADALAAARTHLQPHYGPGDLARDADVREAIEGSNQIVGREEYLTLERVPVAGHRYVDGASDRRPRCRECREPIELDDPADPQSWIHAEDANDLGDHSAEAP